MKKILFICHGNICRSPMAEYIFKKLVKDKGLDKEFEISSASTSKEAIGSDIYSYAKTVLFKYNIPFDRHIARQITNNDLSYYDYIIAMEEYNINNLNKMLGSSDKYSLLLDYTDKPGDISDPWYTRDFDKAFQEIEYGCKGLLKNLI